MAPATAAAGSTTMSPRRGGPRYQRLLSAGDGRGGPARAARDRGVGGAGGVRGCHR